MWLDGAWVWRTTLAAGYPETLCERMAHEYAEALKSAPVNSPGTVLFDALGQRKTFDEDSRRRREDRENNECIGGLRRPNRGHGAAAGLATGR